MNPVAAFFKLVRWPNLFFIALTQLLYRYFVFSYVYGVPFGDFSHARTDTRNFYALVMASVCIAAAGYIINDYFDVNIDLINKPGKLVIDRYLKRRWAIIWHIVLSGAGVVLSCYAGYRLHNIVIPLCNLGVVAALWFYSTTFKKRLLIGNILISLLTAWVIFVLMFAEHSFTIGAPGNEWRRLLKVSFIYGGFAFIISLVREVIKDMEDLGGDLKYGCRTMPIVWGIPVSKVFTAVWIVVLAAGIVLIEVYIIQAGWLPAAAYGLVAILLPLVWVLRKLYQAQVPADYHRLSNRVKLIMLAGILSMVFFHFHPAS